MIKPSWGLIWRSEVEQLVVMRVGENGMPWKADLQWVLLLLPLYDSEGEDDGDDDDDEVWRRDEMEDGY